MYDDYDYYWDEMWCGKYHDHLPHYWWDYYDDEWWCAG